MAGKGGRPAGVGERQRDVDGAVVRRWGGTEELDGGQGGGVVSGGPEGRCNIVHDSPARVRRG